jgi:hypothetical protein
MVPIGVVTIGYPLPDRKSGSLKRGWLARDDFARWTGSSRGAAASHS